MLSIAIGRTLKQLNSPVFIRIVITGVILALAILIGLGFILVPVIEGLADFDADWMTMTLTGVSLLAYLIIAYFVFPGVSSALMGLFLEDVTDDVERAFYQGNPAHRKVSLLLGLAMAGRLLLKMLLVNLLVLPLYLITLATGVGALLLYLAVNGFLMGREYYELVALRHMPVKDADRLWKQYRAKIMLAGGVVAAVFLVPIVNLAAPVLGAAFFTHVVQWLLAREGRALNLDRP